MTISYAVLTHNQGHKLQTLVDMLIKNIDDQDQIVIVDDYSDDQITKDILDKYKDINNIIIQKRQLNNNFALQKNYLFDLCKNQYIFNLDADQLIQQQLLDNIKTVLQNNSSVELF